MIRSRLQAEGYEGMRTMFSMINWSSLYHQARQLWTLFRADAERAGQTLAVKWVRPEWSNTTYAPRYATVRVDQPRPMRRPY